MVFKWIIFFNICISGNCILSNPPKACIPTATVQGPCHLCVCDTYGIFICHTNKCENKTYVNPRISKKNECQSQMTYRYEELFCICSYENKWMSFNCRETFQFLKPNMNLIKHSMRSYSFCAPNTYILIDCNICQCNTSGYIQTSTCTVKNCSDANKAQRCNYGDVLRKKDEICVCSDTGYYVDRLCVKGVKDKKNEVCIPNNEYTIDCNRCICDTNERLICTSKACDKNESGRGKPELGSSHQSKPKQKKCTPGQEYTIKCNTCVCDHVGILVCTNKICVSPTDGAENITNNFLTYIHN